MQENATLVVTTPADSLIQVLPAPEHGRRIETGALQIGDDWPGVFMRGDTALPYAMYLRWFLDAHPPKEHEDAIVRGMVESLIRTLCQCDATGATAPHAAPQPAGNGGW